MLFHAHYWCLQPGFVPSGIELECKSGSLCNGDLGWNCYVNRETRKELCCFLATGNNDLKYSSRIQLGGSWAGTWFVGRCFQSLMFSRRIPIQYFALVVGTCLYILIRDLKFCDSIYEMSIYTTSFDCIQVFWRSLLKGWVSEIDNLFKCHQIYFFITKWKWYWLKVVNSTNPRWPISRQTAWTKLSQYSINWKWYSSCE